MLDLFGHIDGTFHTSTATLYRVTGAYSADGSWIDDAPVTSTHAVNDQPATPSQIKWLNPGGERNIELRNIYVNDGTMLRPSAPGHAADELEFDAGFGVKRWKVIQADCRPTRNYCHAIVERLP
jgi:hypothetical protein